MCSSSGAIVLNAVSQCPKRQLIVTSQCLAINQLCGTGPVVYFLNPFTTMVFDGLVQINNTGTSCTITATVTDSLGATPYTIAPGASIKVAVQGLLEVAITCASTGTTAQCTGEIILELQECVFC